MTDKKLQAIFDRFSILGNMDFNQFCSSLDYIENLEVDSLNFEKLLLFINKTTGRNFKVISNSIKNKYKARLREGYKREDIVKAIKNAVLSEYHKNNRNQHLTPEFFSRPTTLDKYSQKPVTKKIEQLKKIDEL